MTGKLHFTTDDLLFLLAVARTGQLSTAARQLRTSHATVSRRIDRLEFALKVKLFERNPRGYVLTGVGQRFVEAAEKIEAETERLQRDIAGGITAQRRVVRLSAPEGFSNFFFTAHLGEYYARHPNTTLELVTIQQIMSLSRKEADIAIALDPPKAGPYFSEIVAEYSLHIYATQDYLATHEAISERGDLLQHLFIGYIEDMIFAPGLDYLGDIHPGIKPHFQSSSIFAQLTAVRNGLGLCVLPHFIASKFPDLVKVLSGEVELRRHYWLLSHRDLKDTPRVRTVIDFIQHCVKRHSDEFILPGAAPRRGRGK